MTRLHYCCWLLALALWAQSANASSETNVDVRLKWFGSAAWLPSLHVDRVVNDSGTPVLDQNVDVRTMLRHRRGALTLQIDHSLAWVNGDSAGASAAQNLNQIVASDRTRLADLTWRIDDGDRHAAWHRLDRLSLRYESGAWSATLGREALSWGGGLVFQPMDLFNPFAPTAVDRDYKPGNDLLLLERVFDNGSDLQLLAVGRRDATGDITGRVGSLAAKWRGFLGGVEYELFAGRHFDEQVFGWALRVPLGGALLRTDWVLNRADDDDVTLTALANIDYSFTLHERSTYVFAEYFYNGFGRSGKTPALAEVPPELAQRILRGELFNVQRNYLALGATYQWHPLWTQALTVIGNLHDGSALLQGQFNYEPGDHQRLEIGFVTNIGSDGDEFAGLFVAPGFVTDNRGRSLLASGSTQAFARWVYYF